MMLDAHRGPAESHPGSETATEAQSDRFVFLRRLRGAPLDHLCAIAAVAGTWKQFKISSAFGLGEIAGCCVILIAALSWRRLLTVRLDLAGACLGAFALALAAGGVFSLLFREQVLDLREYLAFAYSLLLVTAWWSSTGSTPQRATRIALVYLTVYLGVTALLAVLAGPAADFLWHPAAKLRGLSDNPNQIALLATCALCLAIVDISATRTVSAVHLAAISVAIVAGFLSRSGAFVLAFCVGVATLGVLALVTDWFTGVTRKAGQLLAIAVLLAAIMAVTQNAETVAVQSSGVYHGDQQQGAWRVEAWTKALKLTLYSPVFGYGPGSHIRMPTSTTFVEAHNTFVDALLVSGLIGFLALVTLIGTTTVLAYRTGRYEIIAAVAVFCAFCSFHLVLRQPIAWLVLLLMWWRVLAPIRFPTVAPPASSGLVHVAGRDGPYKSAGPLGVYPPAKQV